MRSTDTFAAALNALVAPPLDPEDIRTQLEFDIARDGRIHYSADGGTIYIHIEKGLMAIPECWVIVRVERNAAAGLRAHLEDIGGAQPTPEEQDEIDA